MKISKIIGIGMIVLAGIGGTIASIVYMQNNSIDLPFLIIAGFSLLMLVCGIGMIWMSKKVDPFKEAIKAITEEAEAEELDSQNAGNSVKSGVSGRRPDSTSPAASSDVAKLEANNAQLEANNARLNAIIAQLKEKPKPELSFEEELELGKKQYYEEQKNNSSGDIYSEVLRGIQMEQAQVKKNEKAEEAIKQAGTAHFTTPPPASKPEKVKIKFEWPFGKKKAGLRAILEEEEKKIELEKGTKYGA